jgi:hypothetical protein
MDCLILLGWNAPFEAQGKAVLRRYNLRVDIVCQLRSDGRRSASRGVASGSMARVSVAM